MKRLTLCFLVACCALVCPACSKKQTAPTAEKKTELSASEERKPMVRATPPVSPALFAKGAIVGDVSTVDCTLSGGTKASCLSFEIAGAPADPKTSPEGPYCPPTITSGADEGGTWIDGEGTVYQVDGEFIKNLATLYKDKEWQMYDVKTGKVTVITGARGCEVAGNPRPVPGFNNFCLECPLEALGGGVKKTVVIPKVPQQAKTATQIQGGNNTGVALNGVLFGGPAPLSMILSSHTLGVMDDCGAHANPREGYHYHSANGCSELGTQTDGHPPMIGYAMDGFAIFAANADNNRQGLDECGGDTDAVRGYHYHASPPGTNEIIGCYSGEYGCTLSDPKEVCDASAVKERRGPRPGPRPAK